MPSAGYLYFYLFKLSSKVTVIVPGVNALGGLSLFLQYFEIEEDDDDEGVNALGGLSLFLLYVYANYEELQKKVSMPSAGYLYFYLLITTIPYGIWY